MSAVISSAMWRRTGRGVAQSVCNLVSTGSAAAVGDRRSMVRRGDRGMGDREMGNDRTAGGGLRVMDIVN